MSSNLELEVLDAHRALLNARIGVMEHQNNIELYKKILNEIETGDYKENKIRLSFLFFWKSLSMSDHVADLQAKIQSKLRKAEEHLEDHIHEVNRLRDRYNRYSNYLKQEHLKKKIASAQVLTQPEPFDDMKAKMGLRTL